MCCGYEDNKCFALKPELPEDKDTILQWYLGHHHYLLNDTYKNSVNDIASTIQCALNEGDIIFFGVNCDDEPYIMNTRNNIIRNLKNFDKDE